MEEAQEKKLEIRNEVSRILGSLTKDTLAARTSEIEDRLFDFANFLEAKIALLYVSAEREVATGAILQRCFEAKKIVVLPAFKKDKKEMRVMKVDRIDTDLKPGPRGVLEPDPNRCKIVPLECIDIAIIPGVAFDEKGGRVGSGLGYYDRFMPLLPITTRKVALSLECQIFPQLPMESHDKHVDIIITEKRIIYKI